MTSHSARLRSVPAAPQRSPRVATRRPSRLRPWALFVGIVVVAFFGLTYSRISLDRSAFVLDTLEEQIAEQEARLFDLRVEVAELRDPERIAAAANDLGLVYPGDRIALAVDRSVDPEVDTEYRWAQLRALLGAQP